MKLIPTRCKPIVAHAPENNETTPSIQKICKPESVEIYKAPKIKGTILPGRFGVFAPKMNLDVPDEPLQPEPEAATALQAT